MVELDEIELTNRLQAFQKEYKKVEPYINERRKLTENLRLREEYKLNLADRYNQIIQILLPYSELSSANLQYSINRIAATFEKLKNSFATLSLRYNWSGFGLTLIDVSKIERVEQTGTESIQIQGVPPIVENEQTASNQISKLTDQLQGGPLTDPNVQGVSSSDTNVQGASKLIADLITEQIPSDLSTESADTCTNLSTDSFLSIHSDSDSNISNNTLVENNDIESNELILSEDCPLNPNFIENSAKMTPPATTAQSKRDFMALAGPVLNYKYNGDPLKLETFLTDIDFVEALAEAEQSDLCFKYIRSKLEGKALECMPENLTTVQQITEALKQKIKPESSKVIEGKITSLRLIKGNFSTFAKQAEELAENLRRSLVVEGISKAKAEEMSIGKTVELCRKTARSDVVKSIISSTSYKTPAEVIAKFITESDIAKIEFKQKQTNKDKKFDKNKKSFDKNKKDGKYHNNKFDKDKKFNKNNKYNNNKGTSIRLMQGNEQSPPEGGASTSSAHETYYVVNQ